MRAPPFSNWVWVAAFVIWSIAVSIVTYLDWTRLHATPPVSPPFVFTSASALFTCWGVSAVLLLIALYTGISGNGNPLRLAMGDDGHLSTSKFQFLVWTFFFAFVYAMLETARIFFAQDLSGIGYLPQNVLIAMGLSVTTAVGASAITVSYISSGRLNKTPTGDDAVNTSPVVLSDLIAGDSGDPDLTKLQMLFWTAIAAIVYIFQAHHGIGAFVGCNPAATDATKCAFPDIDAALMVLMGLGQGAYLGGKIVNVDTPRLSSISPTSGPGGTPVTIAGDDLGTTVGRILINGSDNWDPTAPTWSDTQITFTIPAASPAGPWTSGAVLAISVITARQATTNTVSFTIQLR